MGLARLSRELECFGPALFECCRTVQTWLKCLQSGFVPSMAGYCSRALFEVWLEIEVGLCSKCGWRLRRCGVGSVAGEGGRAMFECGWRFEGGQRCPNGVRWVFEWMVCSRVFGLEQSEPWGSAAGVFRFVSNRAEGF
ncbi:hypothetical protein L3X38_032871 [Prunus dulcis]|uniref:Uncharacterized protein n=1 Tax=Prunus dulcis TaxID=3755 RepID=A0AAD4YWG2_PRUDU|nr:hypothetical protein L3X38_032871 [Prunus dulcis]